MAKIIELMDKRKNQRRHPSLPVSPFDSDIAFVERRGNRMVAMRENRAQIDRILPPEFHDAEAEIEFCFRYTAGELLKTSNLKAYGIVTGGASETVEERAQKLMPYYNDWHKALRRQDITGMMLGITKAITIQGLALRQAMSLYRLKSPNEVVHYFFRALNEYALLRGWGDVCDRLDSEKNGFVYVIGGLEGGPYKVGYSLTPERRIRDLQVGSPIKLEIMYLCRVSQRAASRMEQVLHRRLKENRVRGEWFDIEIGHLIDLIRITFPNAIEYVR